MPMEADTTEAPRLAHTVLGSSLSGILARTFCHPLDTVKSRLQSFEGHQHYKGILQCLRSTVAEEGIRGLYRGFGAVTVAGTPATCMYITSYEFLKPLLSTQGSETAFLGHFLAGMGAEAFSCLIFVPVDVIKERLQVQRTVSTATSTSAFAVSSASRCSRNSSVPPLYSGSLDAVRVIAKTEGILGLYKGYYVTLASFGPFSALYFMFYEKARATIAGVSGHHDVAKLPAAFTLTASAAAGAAASVITCPLDTAKLRLQTQLRLQPGEAVPEGHLKGVVDSLQSLWREAGLRGLFRGAGARMWFHTANTCVTFTAFEECRKLAQTLF